MSAVRILATIIVLLFIFILVGADPGSTPWLLKEMEGEASETLPTEGNPLLKEGFDKHTATSDSPLRKTFLYLISSVYAVIESLNSSIFHLNVCLRC